MKILATPTPPAVDRTDRRNSLLLMAFSILGMLVLVSRAVYLVVFTGLPFLDAGQATSPDFAATILDACSMLFCALLLVPALVYSLRRLKGGEIRAAAVPTIKGRLLVALIAVWVVVLILWTVLTQVFDFGWLVAIPFFLLGVALPVAGLAWIGIGGLMPGSRRRLWATLAMGMVGGTGLAIVGEYLVFGLVGLVGGVAMLANPDLAAALEQLGQQIQNAGDIEAMMILLAPYLTNPLVFLALLSFVAGIGPIIEEIVKPLAVLLVGRRLRSPAEGFALGALCGAGFAMLEGLLAATGFTESAGIGLFVRGAASLMHILTSGLMGWGYASLRLEKRRGRMLLMALLAVGIHGLWNGSVVVTAYSSMLIVINPANLLPALSMLAGLGVLGMLFILILTFRPILNYQLRKMPVEPAPRPPAIPPAAPESAV